MGGIVNSTNIREARKARDAQLSSTKEVPLFTDYRRTNDPVMAPDRGFVKQLKKLDPEFNVVWDWGSERWEIWKFPKNLGAAPYHVTTIQTKNKSYRELGADVLLKLQWGDPTRFSLEELVNYFDEMDNQVRRRKAKDFSNKINDITLETQHYVNRLMGKPIQIKTPKRLAIKRMVTNG